MAWGKILLKCHPTSGKVSLVCGITFLWITSMCVCEFIIPSTGTSHLTPQKLKQAQSIFFRRCFTTWLKRQGLSFSPSLILTCRLCFPFTKNDVHQKIKLFFGLVQTKTYFLAYAIWQSSFHHFLVYSCFFVGFLAFRPASISRCLTVAGLTWTPEYAKSNEQTNKLFWWLYFIISQRFAHLFKWVSSGQCFQPQNM